MMIVHFEEMQSLATITIFSGPNKDWVNLSLGQNDLPDAQITD